MLSEPEDQGCVKRADETRTRAELAEDLARLLPGSDGRFQISLTAAERSLVADVLNATASVAEPDPIFAAIKRHRAALGAYDDFCHQSEQAWAREKAIIPDGNDELGERFEKHELALADLVSKKPTTTEGCAAALRYVHTLVTDGGGGLTSAPARWFFKGWRPPATFLANIAEALEGLTTA
jgi:hypothetical protein